MVYTISNGFLEVQIASAGAELQSVRSKSDGAEYLWQGDKTYWGGRAYNLFPICGRLTDGKYTYRGKTYEMNLHGFLRKSELEATQLSEQSIDFCLTENEKTLEAYPFKFEYHIIYTLVNNKIVIDIYVINRDSEQLIFALGGHHGFNVPIVNGKFEDYSLEFCEDCSPRSIDFSPTCYTLHTDKPFTLNDGRTIELSHAMFDNDAIVLSNIARKVTLKSVCDSKSVTVEYPQPMRYLGLWHAPKTEAPYISIEPWTSVPAYEQEVDDLETKRDMIKLESGKTYNLTWSIEIN